MGEKWLPIKNFESKYEISNLKNIRNKNSKKLLTKFKKNNGKEYVGLMIDNKHSRCKSVDMLYEQTFEININNNLGNEIWKDIIGYEGYYQVSNKGRIRSLNRYITQSTKDGLLYQRYMKGKILSLDKTNGDDYLIVSLCKGVEEEPQNYYIHRLVAKYFIDNPSNLPEVNHKDGIKEHNYIENLEWCTHQENEYHAYHTGLNVITEYAKGKQLKGSQCHSAKLTEDQVKEIKEIFLKSNLLDREIANKYHVIPETIRMIRTNQTWKHVKLN